LLSPTSVLRANSKDISKRSNVELKIKEKCKKKPDSSIEPIICSPSNSLREDSQRHSMRPTSRKSLPDSCNIKDDTEEVIYTTNSDRHGGTFS
jgi:hypothetical protein